MAQKISLRDNATDGQLTGADIDADGNIFVSAEQSNIGQSAILYKAADITARFNNLTFSGTGGSPEIQTIIEGKDDQGNWFPVGYQFNPYRDGLGDQFHTVVIDPNIFWADAGVSNIVYVGGRTIGEISPQQVTLPTDWRACVHVFLPDGTTLDTLDIDMSAELVNREN